MVDQNTKRYEIVRKLNPRAFYTIWTRALKGELFDSIIDEMVKEEEYRMSSKRKAK